MPTFTPGIKAPESASPARWYLYQGDRLVLGLTLSPKPSRPRAGPRTGR